MRTHVLSLGGSTIVPDKIDVNFLKRFRKLILSLVKNGHRFVIVCGGGRVNREYNKAARKITKVSNQDLDWLGIAATRFNAELIRVIFSPYAHKEVIYNPTKKIQTNRKIIIGAGYKPGCSTDKDAVLLARQFKAKEVINLFDKDYVYTSDPDRNKKAKPLKQIAWPSFLKLLGPYKPGGNWPFDPEASRLAYKLRLKLIAVKGTNLNNLSAYLKRKKYKGTIIS